MKKISRSNNGFTLVELLAVVAILGVLLTVGIVAVTKLIDRAKNEQLKSQEQTLVMAAKNYLQENRSFLPKNIGETTTVSVELLKSNKYITEDIINDKKESCMRNTYVTAYKENSTKYVYKAHIYCGNEAAPITEVAAIPTVTVDFVDLAGNSIKNDETILEKVSEAKFIIDFTGGYNEGKEVPIDGYSYSIFTQVGTNGSLQEVYNSGTISAGRSFSIHVDRDNNLIDYIDVTDATTVVIKATVRNTEGGVNSIIEFLGSDTSGAQVVYQDKTAPTCVASQTIGEAAPNDWINLNTAVKERKVTVVCRDGSGSGCIRSSFTKTLSGTIEEEYDDIEIKDNAGNVGTCRVRVNFDRKKPRISVDAYTRGKAENSISGNSILLNAPKTTDSTGSGIINEDGYSNLINGFMSKAKYPYGVIYKVTINDLAVRSWKWEVNEIEIESKSDSRYDVVSTNISEGKTGTCDDISECVIYVNLIDNGLRKGVLTVTDRAGNTSSFTMYAKIDKRAPGAPTILNSSNNKSTGDWTDAGVNLTLTSDINASSIENYYYTYNENVPITNRDGVSEEDAEQNWVRFDGGSGKQTFTTETIWNREMDKTVYVMVCDIMENCSESNSTAVRIDRTAPTGLTLRGFKKENADNITAATGLEMIENNTWHSGWVLVVPRGATDTGSGDLRYLLTVTGASENVDEEVQNYRNVNAEGISYVSFKACDKVGNCSSAVQFVVKLDRTGPTAPEIVNSSGGQWTKNDITLTIRNSRDTGSTIGNYYYSHIANPEEYGSTPDSKWVLIEDGKNKETFTMSWDDDINKTVYLKACDKVGNCSTVKNTTVKIDKTAPSKPTIYDEKEHAYVADWTNKNFSLVLKSDDGKGSGLDDYQYTYSSSASAVGDDSSTQWVSNDGDFDLEKTKFTTTPFKLERNQNVYIRVCDKVGNCSTKASALIQIDKTPPTCSDGTISVNNSASGVTGEVACIDSASHCVKNTYDYKNLKETASVTIKDNAGNEKECSIDITPYDCSTSSWDLFWIYSKRQNSCPADTEQYDYDYGSCLTKDNYHIDACSVGCGEWCNTEGKSCGYVCCIYRSKTTCYRH